MSNNKQSSVEWLVKKLADLTFSHIAGFLTKEEFDTQSIKVIEQAKFMHKQENLETWLHCLTENDPITFEEYYNETFGGNK